MINKKFANKYFGLFLIFILIFILSSGCNNIPQRPQENEEGNSPPELPEVLADMEEEILNTMYDIDALKGIEMAITEEEDEIAEEPSHMDIEVEGSMQAEISVNQEAENGEEEENGGGGGGENAASNNDISMIIEETAILHSVLKEEDIEGGATVDISEPPDGIDSLWHDINNQIEKLHRHWNVLEADLKDVNVSQGEIEDFEETLNSTTVSALNQEDIEALFLLNTLTKHLANFRNSFENKVPGNVYKMKYHIRHSVLLASEEKYQDAQDEIDKAKEIKSSLQQELAEKEAQNVVHKFDLSIEDLKRQLDTENFHLIQTEAAIVMKNIILIEDTYRGSVE